MEDRLYHTLPLPTSCTVHNKMTQVNSVVNLLTFDAFKNGYFPNYSSKCS